MRHEIRENPVSPWKHKAKVLIAFLALCLVAAFSGIGFAADQAGTTAQRTAQIFR